MANETDMVPAKPPGRALQQSGFNASILNRLQAAPPRFGRITLGIAVAGALSAGVLGTLVYNGWFNEDQQTYANAITAARNALGVPGGTSLSFTSANALASTLPPGALAASRSDDAALVASATTERGDVRGDVRNDVRTDLRNDARSDTTTSRAVGDVARMYAGWSGETAHPVLSGDTAAAATADPLVASTLTSTSANTLPSMSANTLTTSSVTTSGIVSSIASDSPAPVVNATTNANLDATTNARLSAGLEADTALTAGAMYPTPATVPSAAPVARPALPTVPARATAAAHHTPRHASHRRNETPSYAARHRNDKDAPLAQQQPSQSQTQHEHEHPQHHETAAEDNRTPSLFARIGEFFRHASYRQHDSSRQQPDLYAHP